MALVSQNANTVAVITNEVLANSIGGTVVANSVRLSNTTANGSIIEFLVAGQSLPVSLGGASTNYPPVQISIYAGSNGNTQDQVVLSGNIFSTADQNGAFIVNGMLILKGNGASGGANANTIWGGNMQIPGTALAGDAKTIATVYAGPASNGNVNVQLFNANTCNVSLFVQPQTGANCNASITQFVLFLPQGVI